MPDVWIGEICVSFPFEPYPSQVDYMRKVLQCLHMGWNGALESPTGTGKTLSLLCASLAWLQHRKTQLHAGIGEAQPQDEDAKSLTKTASQIIDGLGTPRIFYAARTHSQLSQVVRELNRTAYKNVRMVIFGSRDQLCIHEEVSKVPSMGVKNQMCRAKVSKHSCHFFNGYEKASNMDGTSNPFRGADAMDIEDFVKMGKAKKSRGICPFYASRDGWQEADLVLIPYNYILDPRTRRSNKIDLRGSIVIFDEAHNLAKMCEDSVSVTLSSKGLAAAIRETKLTHSKLTEATEKLRSEMDDSSAAFGAFGAGKAGAEDDVIDLDPNKLLHLTQILQELESNLDKIHEGGEVEDLAFRASRHKGLDGREFGGGFLPALLAKSGLEFGLRDEITDLVNKIGAFLAHEGGIGFGAESVKGAALETFSTFISNAYPGDENVVATRPDFTSAFTVYLAKDEEKEFGTKAKGGGLPWKTSKAAWTVNCWCYEAGMGMELVATKGMRSVLVTSGTLSPINAFIREMRIPFQGSFESEHVIGKGQVWAGILSHGPGSVQLNSAFHNRSNLAYLDSLGSAIVSICGVVPEGVLVFFASYAQLNACTKHWKSSGMLQRLEALKTLVVEPRGKAEFIAAMAEFDVAIRSPASKGAVFFAVCRGKVSEGIDFSDRHGRAVLVAGIPYPPLLDPRVCLKKAFLDRKRSKHNADTDKIRGMSGDEWYNMEAVRAVNQALGRVIRHKHDYGAIILPESRFLGWDRGRFPGWVRDKIEIHNKFDEGLASLGAFFRTKRTAVHKSAALTAARDASTLGAVDVAKGNAHIFHQYSQPQKRPRPLIEYEQQPYKVQPKPVARSFSGVFDALKDSAPATLTKSSSDVDCTIVGPSTSTDTPASTLPFIQPKRPKIKVVSTADKRAAKEATADGGALLFVKLLKSRVSSKSAQKSVVVALSAYRADKELPPLLRRLGAALLPDHRDLFRQVAEFLHTPEHRAELLRHSEQV